MSSFRCLLHECFWTSRYAQFDEFEVRTLFDVLCPRDFVYPVLFTYKETGSFSSNKNLGWSFPPKTRFSLQTSKNQNSHPPNFVSLEIQKTSQLKKLLLQKVQTTSREHV